MFDVFSIAAGAAGVVGSYFLYLVATKGLPAALAWAKAKWNAGKTDLANLQGDVTSLSTKVTSLEQNAIAELKAGLAAVQADVAKLRAPTGVGPGSSVTAAAAPAAPAAPAPAAG